MRPAKLSDHVDIRITYEMGVWLDELVRQAGVDSRAPIVRALLQTLMDEDQAAERAA